MIILIGALIIRGTKNNPIQYKYYISNILVKMFFGVSYGVFYLFIYKGGDTMGYFDGASVLNNVFFKSPLQYFEQMIAEPNWSNYFANYDVTTGYPPSWIYKEQEGFFVCKVASIIGFFTLKSYFAMTLVFATFSAHASWKLYQLVSSFEISSKKLMALGVLFLPSVNFWCAGIGKDTIVFTASLYLIFNAFKIISNKHNSNFWNYLIIIIMSFLIYQIRSFVLIAIFVPLFFALSAKIVKYFGGGNFSVVVFRTIIIVGGVFGIGQSYISQSEEDFLSSNSAFQQAEIIQRDFTENETYGDKKYDLGNVEFTGLGLLFVMPLATVTGIFRPFIWEALNPTLILNGIESIFFLYFVFNFLRRNFIKKWQVIRTHEFLIFCFVFIILFGFMTGMTSILYGVLVRLRAPLLPFLIILLTVNHNSNKEEKVKTEVLIK